jgi:HK97 family phage prohead protease
MPDATGVAPDAARENGRPPKDNLVRAIMPGLELRAEAEGESDGSTLFGHFSIFNRWAEIDSFWEGHFLERVAPGAYKKTFREQRPKVLFQHGMDPELGDRAIASPDVLREDETGAYYEARLFDGFPSLILEGLRAGEYGASFRFSVMREEWVEEPGESEHNPRGLPERTLKELRVSEFGPVTFPAYADATAGVRSLTDEFIIGRATREPERLRSLLRYLDAREQNHREGTDPNESQDPAPPQDRAEDQPHPVEGRRDSKPTGLYGLPQENKSWRL